VNLLRPLVVFDLETTGVSVYTDRIVQMAFVKLLPDGTRREWSTLINPGREIPAGATAVHGITVEMVRDAPRFRDVARKVLGGIEGCDLAGFNAARFDWPLLRAELARLDLAPVEEPVILDAMKVFHRFAPRDLGAAVAQYCGRAHEKAHDALRDARATLDVVLAQVKAHAGEMPGTPAEISAWLERKR
jgi:DNA polymerase-3 subunit epsilon